MKKIILVTAAAAALIATPTLAQMQRGDGAGTTRAQVETQVRTAFARVDTNRDGFIDQAESEAVRGAARATRGEGREDRREAAFERLDANNDGAITRAEFMNRAQSGDRAERRASRTERRADRRELRQERRGGGGFARLAGRRFERVDANKDGRISLAEATLMRLQRFDRIDANRDGRITREERQAVRAARQARRG